MMRIQALNFNLLNSFKHQRKEPEIFRRLFAFFLNFLYFMIVLYIFYIICVVSLKFIDFMDLHHSEERGFTELAGRQREFLELGGPEESRRLEWISGLKREFSLSVVRRLNELESELREDLSLDELDLESDQTVRISGDSPGRDQVMEFMSRLENLKDYESPLLNRLDARPDKIPGRSGYYFSISLKPKREVR